MRVYLYEDRAAINFWPLSLARPVFDLRLGTGSLAAKQAAHWGGGVHGLIVRPALRDVARAERPGVLVNDRCPNAGGLCVLVNGRWLPPADHADDVREPCLGLLDEEIVYAAVREEQLGDGTLQIRSLGEALEKWKDRLPTREAGGRLIHYPWDLVQGNALQIHLDLQARLGQGSFCTSAVSCAVAGARERLLIDPSARIDAQAILDTTRGPVAIERGAVIGPQARIEGPCSVACGSHVAGGRVRGSTIGPHCRIAGDVEGSILQGHVEQEAGGCVSQSYLGEWVHLGAGVTVRDRRANFEPVLVRLDGSVVRSGLRQIGSFIGDHCGVRPGALLDAGTTAGIFSTLIASTGPVPHFIPSFATCWNGALQEQPDVEALLAQGCAAMPKPIAIRQACLALYRQIYLESGATREVRSKGTELALRRSA